MGLGRVYKRGDFGPELVNLAAGNPVVQLAGLDPLYDRRRVRVRCGDRGVLGIDGWLPEAAASRCHTLRPSCSRRVILAMHNYVRAPVAQPDRAAAF